jgi:diguanylate cyclase (GGDEF)-like protein
LLSHYEQSYQKNIYLVDSTGRIRLTGDNRLHDTRSIYQMDGLKDIAANVLSRQSNNFQYRSQKNNYLLHVKYMPEVHLFLLVESEENQAIAQIRRALYLNIVVFVLIVLATIILTNMTVGYYQKKLAVMATIDHLTKLMNRQAFDALSVNVLADSRRHKTQLTVLMMDIDYFKKVNDSYGHAAGDKVLQGIAQILTKTVREADLVCRWSSDVSVIFFSECDAVDAERITEQIRTKVATQTYKFELYHLNVTFSLGDKRKSPSFSKRGFRGRFTARPLFHTPLKRVNTPLQHPLTHYQFSLFRPAIFSACLCCYLDKSCCLRAWSLRLTVAHLSVETSLPAFLLVA